MHTVAALKDVETLLWKRAGITGGKALLGIKPVNEAGETKGSGNTFIEVRSTLPVEEVVRPGAPFKVGEKVEFTAWSSDGSSVQMQLEYNRRGGKKPGKQTREIWRFVEATGKRRPKEWAPGFRLPNELDKMKECFLLLIRDGHGMIHARAVLPREMKGLPAGLAEELRAKDAGLWRPPR